MSLDGRGYVLQATHGVEDALTDTRELKFDGSGRTVAESVPHRAGTKPQWIEYLHDGLGRVHTVRMPDGGAIHTYFNESRRPPVASSEIGETQRTVTRGVVRCGIATTKAASPPRSLSRNQLVTGTFSCQTVSRLDMSMTCSGISRRSRRAHSGESSNTTRSGG